MLSEQRIKEAESNVRTYLQDSLLTKSTFNKIVFDVLFQNAKESLEIATFLANTKKSDLWVIITSYYAMYYVANAVLYKKGYKVGGKISHKITSDALITFVRKDIKEQLLEEYEEQKDDALAGIKADELVESFDFEREKRGRIQYQTTPTEKYAKSKTSLKRATAFMFEIEKLID